MTLPLMDALQKRFPGRCLALSTMTETGQAVARNVMGEEGAVFFSPLDLPWCVRRVLDALAPRALFIAETEIWPNLLHECGQRGIPVVLFNGRISDRSFARYRRFRFFFKEVLRGVGAFAMQSEEDADRILRIGASPDRVVVTGNLKFDRPLRSPSVTEMEETRRSLGLQGGQVVFVAGSTHRGEEGMLVEVFRRLKGVEPSLVLILAPRHLDRLGEIVEALEASPFVWTRRTQLGGKGFSGDIILLDTMGELEKAYSIGTIVFVGGSLVPVGGHNILEPAAFGKPVIFGPYMENFRDITAVMREEGGGIQVRDSEGLYEAARDLLTERSYYGRVSRAARRAIQNNQGALQRTLRILETYLEQGSMDPA